MTGDTATGAAHPAVLAFGCGSLGTELGWRDSVRLVEAALQAGFRHFDTAPPYGAGQSERILGEVLASCRGQITLVSKAGIAHPRAAGALRALRKLALPVKRALPGLWSRAASQARESASPAARFAVADVQRSLDESLRRLRTDHLDALLLHEVFEDALTPELGALLDDWLADGRVRALGTGTGVAQSLACNGRWSSRLRWVQCDHYWGAFTPALRQGSLRLSTHRALRLGLALVRAPAFAAALAQHGTVSLRRRLADDRERGRVLLTAALQQVGDGGTVVVSTLRRERLRDLQDLPAVDDDVLLLNRLFSEALAVPGTHAAAS
jgi:hypothetical protein